MKSSSGFVFGELLVVLAIIATLFAIGVVNLIRLRPKATLVSFVPTLIADLALQQTRAMTGDTHGGSAPFDYGVRFDSDTYTLFAGATYDAADPTNSVIVIPTTLTMSAISFPAQQVVFSRGSGEVVGYVSGESSVTVQDTTSGSEQTITVNRRGVVSSIQ